MPGGKFAPDLDLPITLDRAAPTSIYQQLCEQLRRAILDGRISSGTRLPSTRTLAQTLGVSRTVTSSAYDELFAEGIWRDGKDREPMSERIFPRFHV
jgi:GntR family transcriptional regulator / MocR family aminotransferase